MSEPAEEGNVAGDDIYAEVPAALDEGGAAAAGGDVEEVAGAAPAEQPQSRWTSGESSATLFDNPAEGSGDTSALSHLDPFAPMAVPVAANAETPDDPDELVTGDTQVLIITGPTRSDGDPTCLV